MPFGLTYAEFVMAIGIGMFYGPADQGAPMPKASLTLGTAVHGNLPFGDENFLTLTQRQDQVIWGKFQPIYAAGISDKGTAFLSAGLGRHLDVLGVKVLAFTGPALYADRFNTDILQFRTGFEISQNLNENIALTGGFYHISNAQANSSSADIDVAHLGVTWRF